jgi:hypothetical protein
MIRKLEPAIPIWTVFDHPRDFPDCFLARKFMLDVATTEIMAAPTLGELRDRLRAKGLVLVLRSPEDDPRIMETWL